MKSRSVILAVLTAAFVVGAAMWWWSAWRQFDFGWMFDIRLGMPISEFNACHGLSFGSGINTYDKTRVLCHDGFELSFVRVGEFGHTVEAFSVTKSFPTNEYANAKFLFERMTARMERRGWQRTRGREIPDLPSDSRYDFWQRPSDKFGLVEASLGMFLEKEGWIVVYGETLGHEEAFKVFRKEVEDRLAQTRFEPFSPFGVPFTNTCLALHISDREIVDYIYGRCYKYSRKWKRIPVDRGYKVSFLSIDDQTDWIREVQFVREFADDERDAQVEYATLNDQIAHSISNIVKEISYGSPRETVKSNHLATYYEDRLVFYFPRLMHLTDSTSSVWRVELVAGTCLGRDDGRRR